MISIPMCRDDVSSPEDPDAAESSPRKARARRGSVGMLFDTMKDGISLGRIEAISAMKQWRKKLRKGSDSQVQGIVDCQEGHPTQQIDGKSSGTCKDTYMIESEFGDEEAAKMVRPLVDDEFEVSGSRTEGWVGGSTSRHPWLAKMRTSKRRDN
jgi:hypothetical protein